MWCEPNQPFLIFSFVPLKFDQISKVIFLAGGQKWFSFSELTGSESWSCDYWLTLSFKVCLTVWSSLSLTFYICLSLVVLFQYYPLHFRIFNEFADKQFCKSFEPQLDFIKHLNFFVVYICICWYFERKKEKQLRSLPKLKVLYIHFDVYADVHQ